MSISFNNNNTKDINDKLIANFLNNKRVSFQFGPPSPDSILSNIGNITSTSTQLTPENMLPNSTTSHLDSSHLNDNLFRTKTSNNNGTTNGGNAPVGALGRHKEENAQSKKKSPPAFLSLHPDSFLNQPRPSFGFGGEFPNPPPNIRNGEKITNAEFKPQGAVPQNQPNLQLNQHRLSYNQQDLLVNRRPSFNFELLPYQNYPLLSNRRDSLGMLSVTDPNDTTPRNWMDEDILNNFQFDISNGENGAQMLDHRRKSCQLFQSYLEQRRNSSISILGGFVPTHTQPQSLTTDSKLMQNQMPHLYKQNLHSMPPQMSHPPPGLEHMIRPIETKRKEPEHEEKINMPETKRTKTNTTRPPKMSPKPQDTKPKRSDTKRTKRKAGTKQVRNKTLSSIFRGVSRCSKDGRWQARIRIGPQVKYLGRFKTQEEAAKCYDVAAKEYHRERAVLNFNPDGSISKSVKSNKR